MLKRKRILEGVVFYGVHVLIGVAGGFATTGAVTAFQKLCEKKSFYLK